MEEKMHCPKCGSSVDPATKECYNCGNRIVDWKRNVFTLLKVALVSVFLFIVGYTIFNLSNAVYAKNNHRFTEAQHYYDNLLIADKVFKKDYAYVTAGVHIEQRLYLQALKELEAIEDYAIPNDLLANLKESVYSCGKEHYRDGYYAQAKGYFLALDDYECCEEYLVLIKCHLDGTDSLNYYQYTLLLSFLEREDTRTLLLETEKIAYQFLHGCWVVDGFYFEITDCNAVQHNLPSEDEHPYAIFQNGLYQTRIPMSDTVSYVEHWRSTRTHFNIQIIDVNTIQIYCTKDMHTYTLHRK